MKLKKNFEYLIHVAGWLLILIIAISLISQLFSMTRSIIISLTTVLLLASVAYFNILFIIPRYFKKGKFGWYILAILSLLLFAILMNILLTKLLIPDFNPENFPYQNRPRLPNRIGVPSFRIIPLFFITVATLFLSTIYKLAKDFFEKERRNTYLEKEKIKHELNFLRSQINPHFLFNALNNLHAMVHLKPERAGDYILKLGDMLRYVLEDCKKGKVNLVNEIHYIENYIFFQKLKDENFKNIKFEVSGQNPADFLLEPMLFIALVENAFMHSYSVEVEKRYLIIRLELNEGVLKFNTQNNLSTEDRPVQVSERKESGLGLQNIKRRLELLYPNRHILTHEKRESEYFAQLIIKKLPI